MPLETKRLQVLEKESARPNKSVADLTFDRENLQEVIHPSTIWPAFKALPPPTPSPPLLRQRVAPAVQLPPRVPA